MRSFNKDFRRSLSRKDSSWVPGWKWVVPCHTQQPPAYEGQEDGPSQQDRGPQGHGAISVRWLGGWDILFDLLPNSWNSRYLRHNIPPPKNLPSLPLTWKLILIKTSTQQLDSITVSDLFLFFDSMSRLWLGIQVGGGKIPPKQEADHTLREIPEAHESWGKRSYQWRGVGNDHA